MNKPKIIKPYNWRNEEKKVEPPYIWYDAYTGKKFKSYFTDKYHNSLMLKQIK
jgi:hypothetical protein